MIQYQINKAYPVLMRLSELRLPVKKAKELYFVIKAAEEHFRFAVQEEIKYLAEFGGKRNPDGTLSFETPEQFGLFSEKLSELDGLNIDWTLPCVSLTENDLADQSVSPLEIHDLEGFVSFE